MTSMIAPQVTLDGLVVQIKVCSTYDNLRVPSYQGFLFINCIVCEISLNLHQSVSSCI